MSISEYHQVSFLSQVSGCPVSGSRPSKQYAGMQFQLQTHPMRGSLPLLFNLFIWLCVWFVVLQYCFLLAQVPGISSLRFCSPKQCWVMVPSCGMGLSSNLVLLVSSHKQNLFYYCSGTSCRQYTTVDQRFHGWVHVYISLLACRVPPSAKEAKI